MPGPAIRTDIVEVYVFRRPLHRPRGEVRFLQLRRAVQATLPQTWQPVMGHVEAGETAAQAALRELREETGYCVERGLMGLWQLETPSVYFLHRQESVMISPCFAAQVDPAVEPVLDASHDAARWVERAMADRAFLWPGQRAAVTQIVRDLLEPGSRVEPILRIDLATLR
ncbi:MAG TPA: NUDIX domain-containing protein [Phycisphaeraceae bacterium]